LPLGGFEKQRRRKKVAIFLASLLIVAFVGYVSYAFYWPISNLLGEIFKNPGAVLSFFKEPSGKLESTDGKTNILLLGIDKRVNVPYTFVGPSGKQEHNGFLSDTIIVLSVDQNTKQTSLISIPRDTWISIPAWDGFSASEGKINSAYSLGNTYDYPGGGLKLAERVVSEHLGIPIHYGVRIDFEGFKKGIDTLGGVDIVVDKTFDDYQYPVEGKESTGCPDGTFNCRFEHLHLDAGLTHMGGATALKYVRSRTGTNSEGSDFARAHRQQKVIQATAKKALSVGTLLDPFKLNSLFRDFGQAVETDFDLKSLPKAVRLAKEINIDGLRTFVLDPSSGLMYSPSADLYGGAYVIIPRLSWNDVRLKIKDFLNPSEAKKK
jgi:LCP family protein required for cell wall assembly